VGEQVLLGFSVLLGNPPTIDLMGIVVGHTYYFLEDVYPYMPAGRGRKPLRTPWILQLLTGQVAPAEVPAEATAPRVEAHPAAANGFEQ